MAYSIKLGEGGDRRPASRPEKNAGSPAQAVPVSVAITAVGAALSILGVVVWLQLGSSGYPSGAMAAGTAPVGAEGGALALPGPEDVILSPAFPGQAPEAAYGSQPGWSVPAEVDPDPDALPSERQRSYSVPAGFDPNPDALPGERAAGG